MVSTYDFRVTITFIGINVLSNLTCEENELTPDDYIKIVWTSAAELPGIAVMCSFFSARVTQIHLFHQVSGDR